MEVLHCTSNNRISVTLQTFNVLPVPLASPRPVSGLVVLEDCFAAFCHIEQLTNVDSTSFSWNNTNVIQRNQAGLLNVYSQGKGDRQSVSGNARGRFGSGTPQRPTTRSTSGISQSTDSAIHTPLRGVSTMVSPILGKPDFVDDSGFVDSVFRTSTPVIDGRGGGEESGARGDVQRRCLLRQLPECLIIQLMRSVFDVLHVYIKIRLSFLKSNNCFDFY